MDSYIELIQNADEKTREAIYKVIKECYEMEYIPGDFRKSQIVLILKKGDRTLCKNYRTISHLSHTSKILLTIVKNQIRNIVEENMSDEQFGFRRSVETRIIERRIDMNNDTIVIFIDLKKAFDNVNWERMFDILKKLRSIRETEGSSAIYI